MDSFYVPGQLLYILGIMVLVILAIAFVMYILYSIGLYKMGQRAGVKNSWLAFIPPLNGYVIGKILGPNRVRFFGQDITNPELVITLVPVGMGVISSLATVGSSLIAFLLTIVNIIAAIFLLVCNYQLLKMYKGNGAKLIFILSVIFPIIWPFVIFSLRNKDPIDGQGYYGNYNNYDPYQNNYYENY